MKQYHTVTMTAWVLSHADDRSELYEIQRLGDAGVYEARFETGEQRVFAMLARFDALDNVAIDAALRYLLRNATRQCKKSRIVDPKYHIDGEPASSNVQQKQTTSP